MRKKVRPSAGKPVEMPSCDVVISGYVSRRYARLTLELLKKIKNNNNNLFSSENNNYYGMKSKRPMQHNYFAEKNRQFSTSDAA